LRGRAADREARPTLPRRQDRALGSCRLQIGLEGFDRDFERGIGGLAPQIAAAEDDRIEPLRIFTLPGDDRIGEHMTAAHRLDRPDLAARIAGKAVCETGLIFLVRTLAPG